MTLPVVHLPAVTLIILCNFVPFVARLVCLRITNRTGTGQSEGPGGGKGGGVLPVIEVVGLYACLDLVLPSSFTQSRPGNPC